MNLTGLPTTPSINLSSLVSEYSFDFNLSLLAKVCIDPEFLNNTTWRSEPSFGYNKAFWDESNTSSTPSDTTPIHSTVLGPGSEHPSKPFSHLSFNAKQFETTSGSSVFHFQDNVVSDRCALLAMEICRCHAPALQLRLMVPSHALDHLRGIVFHCIYVLLHSVPCSKDSQTILKRICLDQSAIDSHVCSGFVMWPTSKGEVICRWWRMRIVLFCCSINYVFDQTAERSWWWSRLLYTIQSSNFRWSHKRSWRHRCSANMRMAMTLDPRYKKLKCPPKDKRKAAWAVLCNEFQVICSKEKQLAQPTGQEEATLMWRQNQSRKTKTTALILTAPARPISYRPLMTEMQKTAVDSLTIKKQKIPETEVENE